MNIGIFAAAVFAPLFGTLLGAAIAHRSGVPFIAFAPNLVAFVFGVGVLAGSNGLATFLRRKYKLAGFVSIALIGSTMLDTGIDSVHRWIMIGPLHLNISMAILPIPIYCMLYASRIWLSIFIGLLCGVYILQPDMSQAIAFGLAATVIIKCNRSMSALKRLIYFTCLILGVAWSALRVDPLESVEHVERILHLAWSYGWIGAATSVVGISFLCFPMLYAFYKDSLRDSRILAVSYLFYFLGSFVSTEIGNFPVPVIGAGAGPVLGWFFMAALTIRTSEEPQLQAGSTT